ncbi:MAG TPA: response regulator [Spirochaetes bacterium]|nr:response regulator [Spirochaetota bacterium]
MNDTNHKVKDSHFKEPFDHLVQLCEERLDFDRLTVTLKYQNQLLIIALMTNEEAILLDCGEIYDLKGSASEKVLESRTPLQNNILNDPYPENVLFKRTGLKTTILFPIIIDESPVGTLDIFSFNEEHFSETDIHSIEDILYTVTLLLENYNLHTMIRKSETILAQQPNDIESSISSSKDGGKNLGERLKELLENVYDYIFVENEESEIIQVSPNLAQLLQFSPAEMMKESVIHFTAEEDKEKLEKVTQEKVEDYIRFKKKNESTVGLFLKVFQVFDTMNTHSVTIYQASEEPKALSGDLLRQMEGQFGVVDLNYHLQFVSHDLEYDFDDPLSGRKCFMAYNRSSKMCKDCPIEANKLTVDALKNHVVFTQFKDGQRKMIIFSLLKLEDGSFALLEFFKDTSMQNYFEENQPVEEEKEPPGPIDDFIDYSIEKIKSPVSTLIDYIGTLQGVHFNELNEDVFFEKIDFMYNTTRHLDAVIRSMASSLREKLALLSETGNLSPFGLSEIPVKKGKRILIIDPDISVRLRLKNFLGDLGYRMIIAKDGLEGVLLTKKHLPDIVLLEVNPPKVNGFLIFEKIHQHIKKKIYFIMISHINNPKIIETANHMGIIDYIEKDKLNLKNLAQLIYDLLHQSEKETKELKTAKSQSKTTKAKVDILEQLSEQIEQTSETFYRVSEPPEKEQTSEDFDFPSQDDELELDVEETPLEPVVSEDVEQEPEVIIPLEDLGFEIEEMEDGTNFDFGRSEGLDYSIILDGTVIVIKLGGYLTEDSLKAMNRELIPKIAEQSIETRKILINLFDVVSESVTEDILNHLFLFQTEYIDIPSGSVKILSTDPHIVRTIQSHYIGKGYIILKDMVKAFSLLQMEI